MKTPACKNGNAAATNACRETKTETHPKMFVPDVPDFSSSPFPHIAIICSLFTSEEKRGKGIHLRSLPRGCVGETGRLGFGKKANRPFSTRGNDVRIIFRRAQILQGKGVQSA